MATIDQRAPYCEAIMITNEHSLVLLYAIVEIIKYQRANR